MPDPALRACNTLPCFISPTSLGGGRHFADEETESLEKFRNVLVITRLVPWEPEPSPDALVTESALGLLTKARQHFPSGLVAALGNQP